ncbi:transglycosylase domain-containing protein [Flavobacterium sp. MR2016-29]|uniref:transglycosylase domain-containing protein n=1 Tax=Flavobacterium sp. MR2016-29 TaxID=2783795 RepID=UPI00188C7BAB|nr:transglycosylase domain-containing protein [Flavobacterium sp. MR2016-29]MBF4493212.1 transglycosylase domain-containing protein [Flavobacterium sp. MR2016-29]
MVKKYLKLFISLVIILAITIAYLLSDFTVMYKNEEFVDLTHKTKEAQKENLKAFTKIYEKINTKMKEQKCPCDRATDYIGPYRHGYSLTKLFYKLKIQREFTQTDCFKYLLLNTDFKNFYGDSTYKTFGVKEASEFYFNKKINKLNEKEVLTLIAMLQNPSLYDPIRNKKVVQSRVLLLEHMLHTQDKN